MESAHDPRSTPPPVNAALQLFAMSVRLYFRNRMAMLYGYLFPTLFLVAFWVLYRHEGVPLVRHMGELLTVTALGGACFGLPTALVSERERGIWRRYRLAPVSTGALVASTVLARYVLLLTAALLQLALAMLIGMPFPRHFFDLWLAFTFVAFAFLGLGLLIAMLADNVPTVQALGQCIFLPMLILGGVAVRLEALPEWAQRVSGFFPGRYAVEAIQATVTGEGIGAARFALLALLLIGAAGCTAGANLFRWDPAQRLAATGAKGWVAVALGSWVGVGLLAEASDRSVLAGTLREERAVGRSAARLPPVRAVAPPRARFPAVPPADTAALGAAESAPIDVQEPSGTPAGEAAPTAPTEAEPTAMPVLPPATASWEAVTVEDIDAHIRFDRLPPDRGLVTPIAPPSARPHPEITAQLECVREALPRWGPGRVGDPVQRVRNLLLVAAAPDLLQMEQLESLLPQVVFHRLQQDLPREQLIQLLYWIAMHPDEGSTAALRDLDLVCLDAARAMDMEELRLRTAIYAAKLLGRLTGRITPR